MDMADHTIILTTTYPFHSNGRENHRMGRNTLLLDLRFHINMEGLLKMRMMSHAGSQRVLGSSSLRYQISNSVVTHNGDSLIHLIFRSTASPVVILIAPTHRTLQSFHPHFRLILRYLAIQTTILTPQALSLSGNPPPGLLDPSLPQVLPAHRRQTPCVLPCRILA